MVSSKGKIRAYAVSVAVFGAVLLLALFFGGTRLSPGEVLKGLFLGGEDTVSVIMRNVRLPRALGCAVCGTGLSVSGVILQSVTDNGLAGPNIIGVNSGAGFAAILFLCFFPKAQGAIPFAAFFGAFCTTVFILWLAGRIGSGRHTVILAGMALSAVLNAGISFISLLDTDVLASYNYFSIGGMSGVTGGELWIPGAIVLVSWIAAMLLGRQISVLSLGDGVALSLGVSVRPVRFAALLLASASAAAAVSFAGLLGFVGLVVPHILRRLFGNGVTGCLLGAPLVGGALVLAADLVGRWVIAPGEIPVGIVMAFIGAPFFVFLLLRRRSDG